MQSLWYQLHIDLWYIAGSICFFIGTGIKLYRILKAAGVLA